MPDPIDYDNRWPYGQPEYLALREPAYASARAEPAPVSYRLPTLDGLIDNGYLAVTDTDPVSAMLGDRQRVAGLGLGDLIDQIQRRHDLYRKHLDELEQSKMAATNAARDFRDLSGRVDAGQDPDLQSIIRDLDAQQREQRTSFWRDMSGLRQSLPPWIKDYLAASRRHGWLGTSEIDQSPYADDPGRGGGER